MSKLYVDFESYCDVDLNDVGAYIYANHPSADILCLGYKFGDEQTQIIKYREPLPQRIIDHVESGGICSAHNAFFDRCIWQFVAVKKFGWPVVKLQQWECTMLKVASHGFPLALEKAAEAMNLPIGKDLVGGRILNRVSKPQKDGRRIYPKDDPNAFSILYKYCTRDVDVMYLFDTTIPDIDKDEYQIWYYDQKLNARGIPVDILSLDAIIPKLEEEKLEFNDRISEMTKGVITKITQTARIVKYANEHQVFLPNLQKETVEEFLETYADTMHEDIFEILEMRQMGGKSSTNKFKAMKNSANPKDSLVRGTLIMYGAQRTGRWAGRQVQPHNFPKPTVKYESIDKLVNDLVTKSRQDIRAEYGSFMHAASTATRGMICARDGKILNIADYNAIEPRILFWLADETEAIETFKTGDIYVEMAKTVYHDPNLTKADEEARWLGKQIIIGCGYGMGPPKFQTTCANYGRNIDFSLAELSVFAYREKYSKVVKLWNGVENAAKAAILNPGKTYEYGYLRFKMIGEHLYMRLPKGRKIVYPYADVREVTTPWGQKKRGVTYKVVEKNHWHRTSTFGGKIIENACQGIARDFMAHGMMTADLEGGYDMVTTVHDEAVSETDENFGSIEEYCELLVQPTSWGVGCPLKAEGKRQKRYQKL